MMEVVGDSERGVQVAIVSLLVVTKICGIQDEVGSYSRTLLHQTLYSDAFPALIGSYFEGHWYVAGNNDVSLQFSSYITNVFSLIIRNGRVTSVKYCGI
jgi:hypothetical protein